MITLLDAKRQFNLQGMGNYLLLLMTHEHGPYLS